MNQGGNATGWRKREIEDAQAEDEAFSLIGLRCAHGVLVEDCCSMCNEHQSMNLAIRCAVLQYVKTGNGSALRESILQITTEAKKQNQCK
jgi:hypothetical protein